MQRPKNFIEALVELSVFTMHAELVERRKFNLFFIIVSVIFGLVLCYCLPVNLDGWRKISIFLLPILVVCFNLHRRTWGVELKNRLDDGYISKSRYLYILIEDLFSQESPLLILLERIIENRNNKDMYPKKARNLVYKAIAERLNEVKSDSENP